VQGGLGATGRSRVLQELLGPAVHACVRATVQCLLLLLLLLLREEEQKALVQQLQQASAGRADAPMCSCAASALDAVRAVGSNLR
jgi:hypothetical protein